MGHDPHLESYDQSQMRAHFSGCVDNACLQQSAPYNVQYAQVCALRITSVKLLCPNDVQLLKGQTDQLYSMSA